MITLLAPSKTMNFEPVALPPGIVPTVPYFYTDAERIVRSMLAMKDISSVVQASDAIVAKTKAAYEQWGDTTNPAIYAYIGDVYKGFYATTLRADDVRWAQDHILTLSGLYGVLRPLDEISAYRLEMKAKLAVGQTKNLYEFWNNKLAEYIDETADGVVCVLSSDEYAKVVTAHTRCRIVTPVFLDKKPNGTIGTVPIYSKMMRGVMARWIIDARVDTPDRLQEFSAHGYSYDIANSTHDRPAFYREVMTPLKFT